MNENLDFIINTTENVLTVIGNAGKPVDITIDAPYRVHINGDRDFLNVHVEFYPHTDPDYADPIFRSESFNTLVNLVLPKEKHMSIVRSISPDIRNKDYAPNGHVHFMIPKCLNMYNVQIK